MGSCQECGYEDDNLEEGFHYCPICDEMEYFT